MPDERMHDDDATRDGLPRFIYGEYTGEMSLPERPPADGYDDEAPAAAMDRNTKILVASGGVALVFIVGLVIAALSTGGADKTPAAANAESPAASVSSVAPSPTESPAPPPSPAAEPSVPPTTSGGKPPKTTKPATTTPPGPTATKTTGKPTRTPTRKPTIILPPPAD